MSYIGNSPYQVAFLVDTFSGNGSTTAFTTSVAPANTASVLVAISGVVQDPSTYSVSGTTLTFSAAPPTGTGNISCRYLGIPASGVTTTAYSTRTEFTATSGQTTFTPPSYTVGYIQVYRNGVLLGSADYTATNGTTVVLSTGATTGDLVTTISFYVSSVLNAIPNSPASVSASNLAANSVVLTSSAISGILPVANGGTGVSINGYAVDYLVIGGGGSGGTDRGGGGGAGGYLASATVLTTGTAYTITVGSGGAGVVESGTNQGLPSSITGSGFLPIIADGGGAGGAPYASPTPYFGGGNGGCGGGGSNQSPYSGGAGRQGFGGGYGNSNTKGGGGGGAGAVGGNATSSVAGSGGAGLAWYDGVTRAGGGGGATGSSGSAGSGGSGGGGAGASGDSNANGSAATANTGSGGGGGTGGGTAAGGNGGSGIVIIRYLGSTRGTGGTVTSSGGYTYHTFTTSGSYTA